MKKCTEILQKSGIEFVMRSYIQVVLQALIFFIAAGSVFIPRAWLYFGLLSLNTIVGTIILIKYNPNLLNERAKERDNTKSWDEILVPLYLITNVVIIHIVAGLDIGRFK